MAAPIVSRSTGDLIPADDHNDVMDYIEDGTYRINTLSLNIQGVGEIITSAGDITNATNTNWDAAYSHISANGTSHTYINQDVTTTGTPTFANITLNPSGTDSGAEIANTGTGNDIKFTKDATSAYINYNTTTASIDFILP